MTRDERQRQIQEYLDGCLGAAERRAFEAELRGDTELARRVEFLREVGEALRAEPDPLPPGFYTRLGAGFEAIPQGRSWFRPLSWETAGLVAAVALAAVLFAPSLIRREIGDAPLSSAPTAEAPAGVPAEPARPEPSGRGGSAAKRPADRPTADEPLLDESRATAPQPTLEERVEPSLAEENQSFAPAPAAGREADSGGGARRLEELPRKDDADAARPRSARPADVDEGKLEDFRERSRPVGLAQAEEEATTTAASPLAGSPLEPGAVGPGIVRIVEPSADERRQQPGEKGAVAQSRISPLRSILVGPRSTPLDCTGARLRLSAGGYEILLARGSALHGCRFPLPDDGRAVRVVDPR